MDQSRIPLLLQVRNLRVESNTLHADVAMPGGVKLITFNLDSMLGNIDGSFKWPSGGFSHSSRDIKLDGTVLHAELATQSGTWNHSSIDLNGRIYVTNDEEFATFNEPVETIDFKDAWIALNKLGSMPDGPWEIPFQIK